MAEPTANPGKDSIAELFSVCQSSFKEFLQAIHQSYPPPSERFNLPKLIEEYGRLNIWFEQTQASRWALGRESIDESLRHDSELLNLVKGTLGRLKSLLGQVTPMIQAQDEIDDSSGCSDDEFSDWSSSSDLEERGTLSGMSRSHRIIQQISSQIECLYDLSSLLRRSGIIDRPLASLGGRATSSDAPDDMTVDPSIDPGDQRLVVEQVAQWRRSRLVVEQMVGVGTSHKASQEDETAQSLEERMTAVRPWLTQRLTRASTRRREQLEYWKEHPPTIPGVARIAHTGSVPTPAPASRSDKIVSTTPVTVPPGTSASKRGVLGQAQTNSIPPPPEVEVDQRTFACPYCGLLADVEEMSDEMSWKRHVFRDLRPYICTFEDCRNGGRLFEIKDDWIHHEYQLHRREYGCKLWGHTCPVREDMAIHLRQHHDQNTVPDAQLRVILDLCERQIDPSQGKEESCVVCGQQLLLSDLHAHLAEHLENIALLALSPPKSEIKPDTALGSESKTLIEGSHHDSTQSEGAGSSKVPPSRSDRLKHAGFFDYEDQKTAKPLPTERFKSLSADAGAIKQGITSLYEFRQDPEQLIKKEPLLTELNTIQNRAQDLRVQRPRSEQARLLDEIITCSDLVCRLTDEEFGWSSRIALVVMKFRVQILEISGIDDANTHRDELQSSLEKVVLRTRELLGRDNQETRDAMKQLTKVCREVAESEEKALEWVVSWREENFGSNDIDTLHAKGKLADRLMQVGGKHTQAGKLLEETVPHYQEIKTTEAREAELLSLVGISQVGLKEALAKPEDMPTKKNEATEHCTKVLRALQKPNEYEQDYVLWVLTLVEEVMAVFKNYVAAEEACRTALNLRTRPDGVEPSGDFVRNMGRLVRLVNREPELSTAAELDRQVRSLARTCTELTYQERKKFIHGRVLGWP